jgi:hypothetical protein
MLNVIYMMMNYLMKMNNYESCLENFLYAFLMFSGFGCRFSGKYVISRCDLILKIIGIFYVKGFLNEMRMIFVFIETLGKVLGFIFGWIAIFMLNFLLFFDNDFDVFLIIMMMIMMKIELDFRMFVLINF